MTLESCLSTRLRATSDSALFKALLQDRVKGLIRLQCLRWNIHETCIRSQYGYGWVNGLVAPYVLQIIIITQLVASWMGCNSNLLNDLFRVLMVNFSLALPLVEINMNLCGNSYCCEITQTGRNACSCRQLFKFRDELSILKDNYGSSNANGNAKDSWNGSSVKLLITQE